MNKNQFEKAKYIVQQDVNAGEYYVTQDGDMCVIGALAHSCGISKEEMRAVEDLNVKSAWEEKEPDAFYDGSAVAVLRRMVQAIKEKFRLSNEQLMRLQCVNDSYQDDTRRDRLIEEMEKFVDQPVLEP